MRTGLLALFAIVLSLLIILTVRQSYLYQEELVLIEELEVLQQSRLEENRKVRAGIAVLESPERIDRLAQETLGLEKATPSQTTLILRGEGGQP